jgi:preprotein translocase subunit SecE
MATKDEEKDPELDERDEDATDDAEESPTGDEAESGSEDERDEAADAEPAELSAAAPAGPDEPEGTQPAHLGAIKYVHAAFFAAGILTAYLSGKVLYTLWNSLAEWPTATRALPQLLRYAEDERETFTMIGGAIIGVIAIIQTYRKEHIRRWAEEVATELSKVTWPAKDIVTNGTVVVVVASAIATVYIALLDRLWSFLTNLVYGA